MSFICHFWANKDMKEEKKVATLLTRFDEEAFMLIRNLFNPEKLATTSFTELKKLRDDQLGPKPSELMERCIFNQERPTQYRNSQRD